MIIISNSARRLADGLIDTYAAVMMIKSLHAGRLRPNLQKMRLVPHTPDLRDIDFLCSLLHIIDVT